MGRHLKTIMWRLVGGPWDELPVTFWWLWTSTLVNRVANFVVPFSVLYLTAARSMSDPVAGLLIGLYGLGGIAGSLVGGLASDRCGAKRTLVVGNLGAAVATIVLGVTSGSFVLGILLFSIGVFSGAVRPATNTMITAIVPARSRVRVFALNYWAMNLGFAVACLCAGFATIAGYTALFCIDGASTLACGLMVLFLVRGSHTSRSPKAGRTRARSRLTRAAILPSPLRDKPFVALLVMSVATTALLQQLTTTLPLSMRASGHSPATYGAVAALNGLLVCTLQMPLSALSAKKPLILSLTVGALLMGLGFALTAFASGVLGYVIALVIWTVGEVVIAPATPALTAQLAGDGNQGVYQGVLNAAWSTGAVIGPALGTAAFAVLADRGTWLVCGLVGFAVAAACIVLWPSLDARLAEHEGDPGHQVPVSTRPSIRALRAAPRRAFKVR